MPDDSSDLADQPLAMYTRSTLDPLVCCENPIILRGLCHLNAGLDVAYFEGCLFITCHECGDRVATVLVAEGLDA